MGIIKLEGESREDVVNLLEKWHQDSDGYCCLCGEEEIPVCGDREGYEEVIWTV